MPNLRRSGHIAAGLGTVGAEERAPRSHVGWPAVQQQPEPTAHLGLLVRHDCQEVQAAVRGEGGVGSKGRPGGVRGFRTCRGRVLQQPGGCTHGGCSVRIRAASRAGHGTRRRAGTLAGSRCAASMRAVEGASCARWRAGGRQQSGTQARSGRIEAMCRSTCPPLQQGRSSTATCDSTAGTVAQIVAKEGACDSSAHSPDCLLGLLPGLSLCGGLQAAAVRAVPRGGGGGGGGFLMPSPTAPQRPEESGAGGGGGGALSAKEVGPEPLLR